MEHLFNSTLFFQTADENIKISSLVGRQQFWIGGYRAPGGVSPWTGMWKWTDGSDFIYTNWYVGEPNNFASNEYYIQMRNSAPGIAPNFWNDVDGPQKLPYVCKCSYIPFI